LLNHKDKTSAIYQYGYRMYLILKQYDTVNCIYAEIDSLDNYTLIVNEHLFIDAIIYNYTDYTMSWLNDTTIQRNVPNVGIPHDSSGDIFDFNIDIDPLSANNYGETWFSVSSPLYDNFEQYMNEPDEQLSFINNDEIDEINAFIDYSEENKPIFGSFGFGNVNAGFSKLVKQINDNYDEAIIKLVIPFANFAPPTYSVNMQELQDQITKPTIKLMVTNIVFTNRQILKFLSTNTTNVFLYDTMNSIGFLSVIEYALCMKYPFGIPNSCVFRNVYAEQTDANSSVINSIEEWNKFIAPEPHKE